MRFDKYNSVFNSKTNSGYEDVELKYDCSYAQPNSDCNLLFDDLVNGKEPKGDIRVTFSRRNSPELGENYSFSVDNKYDDKLSDEDITWIVVGSILGVALVTTLIFVCLCCCGCISCCCHCCCKPKNPSEQEKLVVVTPSPMTQPPQLPAPAMPYPQQPALQPQYQVPPAQPMPQQVPPMAPVFPQTL